MRAMLDELVAGLARLCVRIFFRRVEVEGREHLPQDGPVLLVGNHHNSLVDPVLILAATKVRARFLAKSTLWKMPGVRQLLDLAAVIPVYRAQDGVDMSKNQETFAACHEALAAGGAIALFPEGISHDAPHLAKLKTGAARIAMGAVDVGADGLRIVPVGLTFEEKGRFRSRALVRIGVPIDPAPFAAAQADETDVADAARELTAAIRAGLEAVTLNYPSKEEATLVEQAAALYGTDERDLPGRMALAEAFSVRQGFIDAAAQLREFAPEEVDAVSARIGEYAEKLGQRGLRDEHLAARYSKDAVVAKVFGSAWLLLFTLPLALVGTVISYVPYRLVGVVARLMKTDDLPATIKLFGGFFLFPLTWAIWCALAYGPYGAAGAATMALLAPLSSFFAMRFHERYERFFDDAVAWARLRLRRGDADALRQERDAIRDEVEALREKVRPE